MGPLIHVGLLGLSSCSLRDAYSFHQPGPYSGVRFLSLALGELLSRPGYDVFVRTGGFYTSSCCTVLVEEVTPGSRGLMLESELHSAASESGISRQQLAWASPAYTAWLGFFGGVRVGLGTFLSLPLVL